MQSPVPTRLPPSLSASLNPQMDAGNTAQRVARILVDFLQRKQYQDLVPLDISLSRLRQVVYETVTHAEAQGLLWIAPCGCHVTAKNLVLELDKERLSLTVLLHHENHKRPCDKTGDLDLLYEYMLQEKEKEKNQS